MARIPTRFNLPEYHHERLEALAAGLAISRSEVLNRVLASALSSPMLMLEKLLTAQATPIALGAASPSTFMIEPHRVKGLEEVSRKLYMSKDHLVKLALIAYEIPTNSKHPLTPPLLLDERTLNHVIIVLGLIHGQNISAVQVSRWHSVKI